MIDDNLRIWQGCGNCWVPYPSLRVGKEEKRRGKKESEENLHVVR